MTKAVELHQLWNRLESVGITFTDAQTLRRISMTLHRWHELECGDGNEHGSWCITRGRMVGNGPASLREFAHDDAGTPFQEYHHYLHGRGKDSVSYQPLPDREAGAKRRLARIMKAYPELVAYIQTDPRGCALYILRKSDVTDTTPDMVYNSRGIAVHR